MHSIKIKRHISSSTLRIKELDKFIDKDVQILITPIKKTRSAERKLDELLSISQWDIDEKEIEIQSWQIPNL